MNRRHSLFFAALAALASCSGPPEATGPGPGSAEPHLATAPDGSVILSWLEPADGTTALRFSVLGENSWSEPRTIARGDNWFVNWADFPSVEAIDDSLWAAHWLVKAAEGTYEYDVAVSISTDAGTTWGAPVTPHTDGILSEHGFVSLFPDRGGVGALWLDGRDMAHGMTLRSAVVMPDNSLNHDALADELVCDCCQTDVANGPQGPIAVYRNRTEDEIRDIYVTRMIHGEWETGRPVAHDGWEIAGCPVNGPAIAADGNNVAVAWVTAANNDSIVKVSMSTDGGESFGVPIEIDPDQPVGRVDVVMLEDGATHVTWLDQGEGGSGVIRARKVSANGEPGDVETIATTSAGRMSGFPQAVRSGNRIVFAWTDVDGGTTRVKTAMNSL